jgi:hypothetical protein
VAWAGKVTILTRWTGSSLDVSLCVWTE